MPSNTSEIEDRLEEAARTLRRLPNPPGSGAKGYGSSWPEYVREAKHAYGYDGPTMRVVPNPQEIQRMEECLDWLRLVDDPDDRRIVWLRAEGQRWRTVCVAAGCSRATAWRRWVAALMTIDKRLRAKAKPTRGRASAKGGPDEGRVKAAKGGAGTLL